MIIYVNYGLYKYIIWDKRIWWNPMEFHIWWMNYIELYGVGWGKHCQFVVVIFPARLEFSVVHDRDPFAKR